MKKLNKKQAFKIKDVRIYDSGKKFENCPDRYTVIFLFPKNERIKEQYRGLYLGCNFSGEDIFIKCCWASIGLEQTINSDSLYLGKKIKLENMPSGFQTAIENICRTFYAPHEQTDK